MSDKQYTIGLDIGTNSVGWAVVDQNRDLVKKGKQALWGVRMFDESSDAKNRRTYRNSRRRLKRRRERIDLLQEIFRDEIEKIDPTFFQRLNESFFKEEDRNIKCNDLFSNLMTNKEYYKNYPTIWHLRQKLLHSDEKFDIRMVYLAIHHIIKYRGNFLQEGDEYNNEDVDNLLNILKDFNDELKSLREYLGSEEGLDSEQASSYLPDIQFDKKIVGTILEILNIKTDKVTINNKEEDNIGKNAKKKNLMNLLNCGKDIYKDLLIDLLVSNKIDLSKLKFIPEGIEKTEIKLYSETLEEEIDSVSQKFEYYKGIVNFIPKLKDITDKVKLTELLGKNKYLSDAFFERFEDHKKDLKTFKRLTKEYLGQDAYNEMFRNYDPKKNNYVLYIAHNRINGKGEHFNHCNYDDFIKFVKTNFIDKLDKVLITSQNDKEEFEKLKVKVENNIFLLRTNSSSNGSIPMQLHLKELKTILENQSKFYSFFNDEDSKYKISNKDKIISIFKFKRPYYVGPLKGDEYSWAVMKNNNERVLPWNFEQLIDEDETAKIFINRMRNKCTYLKGESDYCIPKDSILFEEYNVLNYLNTLKINGQRIDKELRDGLYNDLFLSKSRVTSKDIKNYIHNHYDKNYDVSTNEIPEVTYTMSSYIKFKEIFGEDFENNKDLIEDIISDITIFEDKKILCKRLKEKYKLDEEKIKIIKSLNYKKTGRLCKKLINEIKFHKIDPETGDVVQTYEGLLSLMREELLNMQEILFSPKYDLNLAIDNYNKKVIKKSENDKDYLVKFLDENITISPIYIRPFIQAMKIIDELQDILGKDNEYFYCVEVTKTNKAEKNKKSKSRYESLKEMIKNSAINIKKEFNIDEEKFIELLNNKETGVKNSDKLYLYFSQLGKDMYSGEDIDISELDNYDIDHIYPQSLIKDDSISNRVLVKKGYNHQKSDKFLCETNVVTTKARQLHKFLFENNFISKTKYNRLTENEVDPNILEKFANRQKVATDQACKALITTLKLYKGVDDQHIIYSKAENISDFRKNNDIYKSRTANNYHHAHDAYLNAVLGKMFNDYFSDRFWLKNYRAKLENDDKKDTSIFVKITKQTRYKLNSDEPIWNGEADIEKIKQNIFNRFDILETTRTYVGNEMLSKVTIKKANSGTVKVKNKTPNGNEYDIEKYGGFDSSSYSKYAIIKIRNKKNEEVKLIPVTRMYLDTDGSNNKLEKYIREVLHYDNFTIENNCIKTNVVIQQDNRKFMITGVTNKSYVCKNAIDRNFDINSIRIIHNLEKLNKVLEILQKEMPKELLKDVKADKKEQIKYDYFTEKIVKEDKIILHNSKYEDKSITITKDDLNYLLDSLKKLYNNKYNLFSYSQVIKLQDTLDNYTLDNNIIKNCMNLFELLSFLKTNERKPINAEFLGLSSQFGVLTIGQTLTKGTKFIEYSPTGLRKKILYEVK